MLHYYAGQYRAIGDIFFQAVHQTAAAAYSEEQRAAWAPSPVDYERWRWRCEMKRPFVYVDDAGVAGFLELDPDGHIDCLYVHPDWNRRGVASTLLQHALQICRRVGVTRCYVEASHLAKGLFLRHGFDVVAPQTVEIRGVHVENWRMERTLEP